MWDDEILNVLESVCVVCVGSFKGYITVLFLL